MRPQEIIDDAIKLHRQLFATDAITQNYSVSHNADSVLNKIGSSNEFWQFRNYQNSDYLKNIDWKKSGRSNDIIVKETQKQGDYSINLVLDNSQNMNFKSELPKYTKFEFGLIIAIAISLTLIKANIKITNNNKKLKYDAGHIYSQFINSDFVPSLKTTNIIISDFLENTERFNGLSQNIFLQINDIQELTLDYNGRIEFYNLDNKILIEETETIRQEYIDRLNAHYNDFKKSLNPLAYFTSDNTQNPIIAAQNIIDFLLKGNQNEY